MFFESLVGRGRRDRWCIEAVTRPTRVSCLRGFTTRIAPVYSPPRVTDRGFCPTGRSVRGGSVYRACGRIPNETILKVTVVVYLPTYRHARGFRRRRVVPFLFLHAEIVRGYDLDRRTRKSSSPVTRERHVFDYEKERRSRESTSDRRGYRPYFRRLNRFSVISRARDFRLLLV